MPIVCLFESAPADTPWAVYQKGGVSWKYSGDSFFARCSRSEDNIFPGATTISARDTRILVTWDRLLFHSQLL